VAAPARDLLALKDWVGQFNLKQTIKCNTGNQCNNGCLGRTSAGLDELSTALLMTQVMTGRNPQKIILETIEFSFFYPFVICLHIWTNMSCDCR